MNIKIFNVTKDGKYKEVPSKLDSLSSNGAYLILDRTNKKIWVYKKEGIPRSLAYAAARAATNLNTRLFSSKFKVVNIEYEEAEQELSTIFNNYNPEAIHKAISPAKAAKVKESVPLVVGEKKVYPKSVKKEEKTPVNYSSTKAKKKTTIKQAATYGSNLMENSLQLLASQILFKENIDKMKNVEKPPKEELRKMLVKHIDALLDLIY